MKFTIKLVIATLILSGSSFTSAQAQDQLLDLFKSELKDQKETLKKSEQPPYYMSYQVIDQSRNRISASFGSISKTDINRFCRLVPQIRIGDTSLDNFSAYDMGMKKSQSGQFSSAPIPLSGANILESARQAIRSEVNIRYQLATYFYDMAKTKNDVNSKPVDNAPWFSQTKIEKYYEDPLPAEKLTLDQAVWRGRLKEITNIFNNYSYLTIGTAFIDYVAERRYFVNSEGTEIAQNLTYARLMVQVQTKAEDGMLLPLYLSYFAFEPENLPSNEKIMADAKAVAIKVGELRTAPVVEPYTGPALLSGNASGVFFHEIFGHRIEGQRMKREWDGQTFKAMVGKYVLPKDMQVYDDPQLMKYNDIDLNGYYKYDDQGVKGERVDVVKDGKLVNFLMTRVPIDGFPHSNGHARVDMDGKDPIARQSNLIIETKSSKSEKELRALFVAELKKQGKEYGYYFKEVTGGFTFTAKGQINSFNVTPLEVYRVYADGRPDLLVRGADLIGTPLDMFSNIAYAGGDVGIFTGMCGAESGWIPVTAISPMLYVSKIEVQRKAKSNATAPIICDPTKQK